ncbi:20700_t:CDS:10 [Entrophospora sp. SA101]|nr:20700_t:CDS:10 [Entrophospora sp. SA101]
MSESSSYTEINSNNNNSTGSTDSNNSCSSRTSNKACNECSEPYESLPWCYKCDLPKYSDYEYGSCNPEVDRLIEEAQEKLREKDSSYFFEWIPFNKFKDFRKIGEGGFGSVFKATFTDRSVTDTARIVALKCIKTSTTKGSCADFLEEWSWSISDNPISDIGRDFLASDEYIANSDPSKGKLHPEAIYVSRFIKFPKIENDDNDISDSDDDGDSTRESKSIQIPKANEESFEELSNSPESLKSPRSPGLQGFGSELFETTEETLVESDSKQLVLTLSKAIPNFSSNQLRTVIETEENSQIDSQEGLTLSAVLNGLSLEDKVKYKINDEEVSLAAIFRSLDSRQLDLCILKACLNGDDITESHQSSDVPGEVDKNLEIVIIESE